MINLLNYLCRKYLPKKLYKRVASIAKHAMSFLSSVKNRLLGKAFYCKALNGESTYNICVNSDMTVTCNCNDLDGQGRIGDLNKHALKEILDGAQASLFRSRLAKGQYAISKCGKCPELTPVRKKEGARRVKQYSLPQGIMVENTVRCNLKCLWCNRDTILATRGNRAMSLQDMDRVAITLRDCEIKEVAFYNLGEPFFSKRLLEELTIIRKYNPSIYMHTSTNGVLVDSDKKREAALLLDRVNFSLDGSSQEKVVKYQAGSCFERSYANMAKLVEFRDARGKDTPVIAWKYVVFAWNDTEEDVERAIELAQKANVDEILFFDGQGPVHFKSRRFRSAPHFTNLPMIHDHHYFVKTRTPNPVACGGRI